MTATEQYRKSQEPLADFVADSCVLGPGREVTAHALRTAYDAWCKENGERRPAGGKRWGDGLRALGCTKERRGAENVHYWAGIDLRLGDPPPASSEEPGWVKGE